MLVSSTAIVPQGDYSMRNEADREAVQATLVERAIAVLGKAVGKALKRGNRHPICPPPGHKRRRAKGFNRSNNRKLERILTQQTTDRPRHL
jgi:hypothetical protein